MSCVCESGRSASVLCRAPARAARLRRAIRGDDCKGSNSGVAECDGGLSNLIISEHFSVIKCLNLWLFVWP